jgi:LuxR family maltose regulon positive regulatory protein
MSMPLLTTKLHIPPCRPGFVSRPRLVDRLEEGLRMGRRLALLSAPAGFGKTTLLSEWIHRARQETLPVAWLSLDEDDNDPARFLTYLVAALQGVQPDLGEGILSALRSPQPPSLEVLLVALANEIASLPGTTAYLLVLDDYHVTKARPVHQALAWLLEHLPRPPLGPHLVVASRSDPPLPLARLRGQGMLTELRVDDLRFTPEEAAAFLQGVAGLPLTNAQVTALESRTEGWITGLQLAALALQPAASDPAGGEDRIARAIQEFAGSHRFVLDYLVEEVLQQQPESLQRFLLETSVLERMTGPLCDAVTGGEGGQAVLEELERANLFVVPLDGERRWVRYHRLFADLLRARLPLWGPALGCAPAVELHSRASAWYEEAGYVADAVAHALDARDLSRAAGLVEAQGLPMLRRGELATLLGWLQALPEETIAARPWLQIYHAWALALSGSGEAAGLRLEALDRLDDTVLTGEMRGHAAAIRAYAAAMANDIASAIQHAQQALVLLPEDELTVRAVVSFTLGGISLMAGQVAGAHQAFAEAIAAGRRAGNLHVAVPALTRMASLQVEEGRLQVAAAAYREALDLASGGGARPLPVAASAYSGLARLLYEWNDLDAAEEYLVKSVELGRQWGNVDALAEDYFDLARLHLARGMAGRAEDAAGQVDRLLRGTPVHPLVASRLAAHRAWLALARGDVAAANRWLTGTGLVARDPIHYTRLFEQVTLARLLLARQELEGAQELLAHLLEAAEREGWLGRAIEILILQARADLAVAHQSGADPARARVALQRAITLAAPQGYVRVFVDEGAPLQSLLLDLRARLAIEPLDVGDAELRQLLAYLDRLLSAFASSPVGVEQAPAGAPAPLVPGQPAGLVEPLSERELEVLRLVAAGHTNQEIAGDLVIAVSTVKSHTHSIYGKLGVKNRTQAIALARALGLL